jgi:hypothetical protein
MLSDLAKLRVGDPTGCLGEGIRTDHVIITGISNGNSKFVISQIDSQQCGGISSRQPQSLPFRGQALSAKSHVRRMDDFMFSHLKGECPESEKRKPLLRRRTPHQKACINCDQTHILMTSNVGYTRGTRHLHPCHTAEGHRTSCLPACP